VQQCKSESVEGWTLRDLIIHLLPLDV
jgi:hypothetical protein